MGVKNSIVLKVMRTVIPLLIILSLFFNVSKGRANVVEKKREELSGITEKLKLKRQQLERVKKQQGQTLRTLSIINKNLKRTQYELSFAENQLQYKEKQLEQNKQELLSLKEQYIVHLNKFKNRIREIHKENHLGYLSLLLTAQTMGDLITRSVYFEKVLEADVNLLQKLDLHKKQIKEKEEVLEKRKKEIAEIKEMFSERKVYYKNQQVGQNRVYTDILKQRHAYEAQIAELEKNSKEIEDLIVTLINQGKSSAVKGTGSFLWPVKGLLTSQYGYRKHPIFRKVRFHTGIDIGVRHGSRIKAADSGQVIFTGWWGGYGQATIIDHGNGYSTVYAHQSRILVKNNQYIKKGQEIGLVGSTGYATGPHLHFEIRKRGKTFDPLLFLK